MKKLNEGPTIKTDHKGSHLTNADGEVVQSFAKDRAGLKDARQAMYKNYKGLNMKKPEPEPQEPVEEDSITENTGGFEVRLDNGGKVSIGKHIFTYHVTDPSEANAVARSAEKSGMTVLDIDSKEIRIDAQAFKHRGLVDSLQELQINGYITEDKKMSDLTNKLKETLEEGITVNTTSTNDENIEDNVTVTATGDDAMALVQMLKMAGIGAPKAQEVEAPAEEMPCMSQSNEIDSMRDMISNMDNVEVIALDDIEAVEEEAELANAPDEKYADTDTLVNKISGGLNRRKKAYAKAENGDNPMAVTESEEELTTRLLKEYDEFKVTAPADSEEGNWEIENVGKWAVKIGNTENVEATDGELDLPFDTDLASALADEAMTEVKKPDADGDGIPDWADKDEEDTDLVEDDVEEGLRIVRKADSNDDKEVIDGDDSTEDALDDEMSEDKK
jgi:hypothetical protein